MKKLSRPSDEEVTITRMLDKVLKRSDAVDKESLCILAGQRVCMPSKPIDVHVPTLFLGVAYTVNVALPGRCGQSSRLRMFSRDSCP